MEEMTGLEFQELVYEATLDILSKYPRKDDSVSAAFDEVKKALDEILEDTYVPTKGEQTVEQYLADAGL